MPYELARLPSEQIARYRLFRGEFGYEDISQRLAQPVIITVLRDPVERVLSLYDYWRVYSRWWPEYDDDPDQLEVRQGIRAALAGDLMYFVAGAHPRVASFANAQTRQIAARNQHYESGLSEHDLLAVAKQHLDQFAVVGLTERLDETILLLAQRFQWRPPTGSLRLNSNPDRPRRPDVAPAVIEAILERNALDVELYAYGREVFERQLKTALAELTTQRYVHAAADRDAVRSIRFILDRAVPGDGWYEWEPMPNGAGHRWMGPDTVSTFEWRLSDQQDLKIEFLIAATIADDVLESLRLRANGHPIALKKRWAEGGGFIYSGQLPAEALAAGGGLTRLEFEVNRTVAPKDLRPDTPDNRKLSVAMRWLEIRPASDLPVEPPTIADPASLPSRAEPDLIDLNVYHYSERELVAWLRDEAGSTDPAYFLARRAGNLNLQQVPEEYARLLHFFRERQIERYLELGIGEGGSFLLNALFNQASLKIAEAVDNLTYGQPAAKVHEKLAFLRRHLPASIRFHQMSTAEFFASKSADTQYDCILIDADHSFDGVTQDFLSALQHLAPTGWLVFHDIASNDACDVARLWRLIKTDACLEFVHGRTCGIGVMPAAAVLGRNALVDLIVPQWSRQLQRLVAAQTRLAASHPNLLELERALAERAHIQATLETKLAEAQSFNKHLKGQLFQQDHALAIEQNRVRALDQTLALRQTQWEAERGQAQQQLAALQTQLEAERRQTRELAAQAATRLTGAQEDRLWRQSLHAEQSGFIQSLKAEAIERDGRLRLLARQLDDRQRTLEAIYQSRHWRLAQGFWRLRWNVLRPYRMFRDWLRARLPYSTRRQVLEWLRLKKRSATSESQLVASAAPPSGLVLSEVQRQVLQDLLDTLSIAVGVDQLLPGLAPLMTPLDEAALRMLLDKRQAMPAEPELPHVFRAADLPVVSAAPSRKMNILFVSGEFPNPLHGGGGRVFDVIRHLSRVANIYLYAWYIEERDRKAYQMIKPYCRGFRGVSVEDFEAGHVGWIQELTHNVPIDVVHYEWPRALYNYAPALGKLHVFTYIEATSLRLCLDLQQETVLSKRWLERMVQLLSALKIETVDAARMDARVVVTQKDGEFLARLNPALDSCVINTAVDIDDFSLPDRPPEPHTLTFVGNYLHYPNEDAARFFCEEVLPDIRRRIPDIKVFLVGAEPTEKVRAYHDVEHVVVTGTVDDIRPYIQRASVCLAPLVSGAGIRGKVNQYAMLRRVCVATTVAAVDLLYRDGQEIFIADDPAVFADRVVYLLQNPEVCRQMGDAAYQVAQAHYDQRQVVDYLQRLYAHVTSRKGDQ